MRAVKALIAALMLLGFAAGALGLETKESLKNKILHKTLEAPADGAPTDSGTRRFAAANIPASTNRWGTNFEVTVRTKESDADPVPLPAQMEDSTVGVSGAALTAIRPEQNLAYTTSSAARVEQVNAALKTPGFAINAALYHTQAGLAAGASAALAQGGVAANSAILSASALDDTTYLDENQREMILAAVWSCIRSLNLPLAQAMEVCFRDRAAAGPITEGMTVALTGIQGYTSRESADPAAAAPPNEQFYLADALFGPTVEHFKADTEKLAIIESRRDLFEETLGKLRLELTPAGEILVHVEGKVDLGLEWKKLAQMNYEVLMGSVFTTCVGYNAVSISGGIIPAPIGGGMMGSPQNAYSGNYGGIVGGADFWIKLLKDSSARTDALSQLMTQAEQNNAPQAGEYVPAIHLIDLNNIWKLQQSSPVRMFLEAEGAPFQEAFIEALLDVYRERFRTNSGLDCRPLNPMVTTTTASGVLPTAKLSDLKAAWDYDYIYFAKEYADLLADAQLYRMLQALKFYVNQLSAPDVYKQLAYKQIYDVSPTGDIDADHQRVLVNLQRVVQTVLTYRTMTVGQRSRAFSEYIREAGSSAGIIKN